MTTRRLVEWKDFKAELREMLKLPENAKCADCGAKRPTWAVTGFGTFVCLRCAGIHARGSGFGIHISGVV